MPTKDLIRATIKFTKHDAMGLDFVHNTDMAQYQKGNPGVTHFLSQCSSPDNAKKALTQYEGFANQYGNSTEHTTVDTHLFLVCDMGNYFDVVFQKGDLIAGVVSVADKGLALKTAAGFYNSIAH